MKTTLSHEEISSLCLELSLLLHAGVGLGDALALLGEESDRANQELLNAMARQVDDGSTLAAAMKETERFPAYVCGLIEVGETAGRTEEALSALSRYYEDRVRMDRRIKSALLYPAVMLAVMLIVIAVLLVRVLPIFDDVYASLGGRLTGVAGGLLALGRGIDKAMPVLMVLMVLIVAFFIAFAAAPEFRNKLTAGWRAKHGDKGVSRKINTAQLAQAMAMGMASGLLPAAQCRLLELGQRSGTSDAAMEKIARDLGEESEAALENAVSRVEPALVLICSLLVGLILLSVMLPLMHIMSAIG